MMAIFIIDDSTSNRVLKPPGKGRGLKLAARPRGFGAYAGVAEPFPDSLLIPRSDYQGIIQERKERQATIRAACKRMGIKVKNQKSTNFCWANAPAHCITIMRAFAGQGVREISAASIACQINNYRNQGGWGREALEFILKQGAIPADIWPNAAISRQYATTANLALMAQFQGIEAWELEPGNIDQEFACVARDIPVACGYNWWAHEVTTVDFDWIDNALAKVIANSWDDTWGDDGYGHIQGSRMKADDAVALRVSAAA